MNERELGCRTLGCGVGMLIVLISFYGMLIATQRVAHKVKEKQAARRAQNVTQNLQSAAIVLDGYAKAHGDKFPPMETPEALRSALQPKYIADASILSDPSDNKPFLPNPALSGKTEHSMNRQATQVYELAQATPASDGTRTVLFLTGTVRSVSASEWRTLTEKK